MIRGRPASVAVVISTLVLAACSGGAGGSSHAGGAPRPGSTTTVDAAQGPSDPAYASRGPNTVALTTLTPTTHEIEVFYPARRGSRVGQKHATYDMRAALQKPGGKPLSRDKSQLVTLAAYSNLPPAPGRFPVVLFSHAYGGFPLQDATLETDLAAWGFVVIAPDEPGIDTRAVAAGTARIDDSRDALVLFAALSAANATPSIGSVLDLKHVAALGHGQGGATALAALAMPKVDTAVAWASVAPTKAVAHKPVMLIGARHDLMYGSDYQRRLYAGLTGAKRLVLLGGGAGNATFTDECADLWETDQLLPQDDVDTGNHLQDLATNGCHPDEVDPRIVWPAIVHFTVAQLRSVFGIDKQPVGLGDAIASGFPKAPLTYEQQP